MRDALDAIPDVSWPRVLDPAMGTGTFLLEAARMVPADGRAAYAEECLFGLDLDPRAVCLAIEALARETGARREVLSRHLTVSDALRGDIPGAPFDAVVGNPPWGAECGPTERLLLRQRFPRVTGRSLDSFKLFLDLASRLTRGSLGMVVPQAVLGQATHADVRAILLERMAPYSGRNLGDGLFPGAAAPACALVFGPRPGPHAVATGADSLPATHWTARQFPLAPDSVLQLVNRLRADHPSLGDLSPDVRVRDVGLNYNRASVAQRVLYAGDRQHERDLPLYRGRDFAAYTPVRPGGWLRHNARALLNPGEALSLNESIYQRREKIVFRQTADRIIATLDRLGAVMGRSVIAITTEGDRPVKPLLVCLNSRLMTVLYRALAGEEGRVLPQVKVGKVLMLPVPRLCEEWGALERLADLLLACEGRDAELLAEADRRVEALYGLTETERDVVRSSRGACVPRA